MSLKRYDKFKLDYKSLSDYIEKAVDSTIDRVWSMLIKLRLTGVALRDSKGHKQRIQVWVGDEIYTLLCSQSSEGKHKDFSEYMRIIIVLGCIVYATINKSKDVKQLLEYFDYLAEEELQIKKKDIFQKTHELKQTAILLKSDDLARIVRESGIKEKDVMKVLNSASGKKLRPL